MSFSFRQEPIKGLYLVYQLLTTLFVRLPLWALFNSASFLRARKSWSLKQAIMVKLLRHLDHIQASSFVSFPDHRAIAPGKGVNGVWIEGAGNLITGDLKKLAEHASVSPTNLPGYWIHKKGTDIKVAAAPQPGEKVVLNLHGGAYIRFSAHPSDPTANICTGFLKHVTSIKRVFSLEYRLSSKVANPFPAALIDALAGYSYLVNVVGFSPADIIIVGDSAGANLAHALTRYLVENAERDVKFPAVPGGLVLLSPWADLSTSHDQGSATKFANSDYLSVRSETVHVAKRAITGPHGLGITETSRYLSPGCLLPDFKIDFNGFPRTFIVGGGAEVLIDQIRTFKGRMIQDLGEGDGVKNGEGKVRYYEAPDAIHDYLVFPWHEPERSKTLEAIAKWVAAASG
ncbi:alpha/beta-hydrolase [Coprinopsis marcescibilis]|uniref:Alpha/beta-hydrolase n=1 Tax=Coprinopsis marcescibilis TaxID=230819 RepID=A0A5C3KLC5_COPMA|nr:alpha/beta-hydrolase [Coprinopsis marcescibilis]